MTAFDGAFRGPGSSKDKLTIDAQTPRGADKCRQVQTSADEVPTNWRTDDHH